jgi:hypothetical protein
MGHLPCLGALFSIANLNKYPIRGEETDVFIRSVHPAQICETGTK